MPIKRLPTLAALAASCGPGFAAPASMEWFAPSTPGQTALWRSDAGLLGQDESPSQLVDLAARGGSYSGLELSYQTDRSQGEPNHWSRREVDFMIETAVEVLPGLVLGLDATDAHPRTAVEGSDQSDWRLFDPQGGLRVGGGVDLLRSWREKQRGRWVVAGWVPVFSQTREWELRTGFVWARKFRLDAAWSRSEPEVPASWSWTGDSSETFADTTWWRSRVTRWSLRTGGTIGQNLSLQAWGGLRQLRDPGAGGEPSWRTWGDATFAGLQANLATGPVVWEAELRAESGTQSLLFDGSSRRADLPDSGRSHGSVSFAGGSARVAARKSMTKSVTAELEASGAWMDLEDSRLEGNPPGPIPAISGSWNTTKRLTGLLKLPVKTKWVEVAPFAGLQCRLERGASIPVWQQLAPRPTGRSWSMPLGLVLERRGSLGGRMAYGLSGEARFSGSATPHPGLRHRVDLQQGF